MPKLHNDYIKNDISDISIMRTNKCSQWRTDAWINVRLVIGRPEQMFFYGGYITKTNVLFQDKKEKLEVISSFLVKISSTRLVFVSVKF